MAASATYADSRAAQLDRRTPWIVAVLATAFFVAVCTPVLPYARQHDFLSFYTGAAIAHSGDFGSLHDLPRQTHLEKSFVPGLEFIAPYIRPPFYALLLAPLSRLSLKTAFALWVSLQMGVLVGLWCWAYRRFGPDALVFCSLFLPAAYGIAHGQDCVGIAAIVLSSWLLLERGRDIPAGAVAALALVKFHLLLLLVPALLIRKRWRMLAGYLAIASAEAGLSLWLIGAGGLRRYLHLLTAPALETLSPSPERMINARALLVNIGVDAGGFALVLAGGIVLAAFLVALRAREDWVWFWTAALGSVLVAPHAYEYDAALLLPPMLICIFRETDPALRFAAATAALPVVYLCTLLPTPWSIAPALALSAWFVLFVRRGVTQS
jgi:hypothetical protein